MFLLTQVICSLCYYIIKQNIHYIQYIYISPGLDDGHNHATEAPHLFDMHHDTRNKS